MKVTTTHLRVAILCLAGVLILYGLVRILWKVDFGPFVNQNLPNAIFVGAAIIFVWNRSLWAKEKKLRDEEEAKKLESEPPKAE